MWMERLAEFFRKGFPLRCSFCRKSAAEVDRLVAGASAYICDACVAECVAVLSRHEKTATTVVTHTEVD
jgi:ATP-dependent protease Clp ATPase subunit